MIKILVTGASGFIGKFLVTALRTNGYEVIEITSKQGDISQEKTWSQFPKADCVVHLAAKSFVPDSWNKPGEFIQCNLLGTVCALNYCKNNQASLLFLSSYLYGKADILPIPESAKLKSTNPYALSKYLAEEACKFYAESFNLNITILRPFNVYGPAQPKHFLIPTIIEQIKSNSSIKVMDLEPKRDYIYIDDLVSAMVKSIMLTKGFNILNIGSGKSCSVEELICMIQKIMGTDLPVISSSSRRKDEIMNTVADIQLAKSKLNWSPIWHIESGLAEICKPD
jgi:nucleoside-diphosphate-sugar epimerase